MSQTSQGCTAASEGGITNWEQGDQGCPDQVGGQTKEKNFPELLKSIGQSQNVFSLGNYGSLELLVSEQ